jgi:hypothetical protein
MSVRYEPWFGTAETQPGQLGQLLELMANPNITLGIISLMTQDPRPREVVTPRQVVAVLPQPR